MYILAIDRLSVIWKSDLPDKIKRNFFQAAVISILLYGCTTWMLTKCTEKKLDGNLTRMLRAILNKSWRQHPTKQQLYGHLPCITKTIKIWWTGHAGHCWRSKDELISNIHPWTPSHGRGKVGRPARTYIQQFCANTGCSFEDLPGAMDDRNEWRERVWEICGGGTTWWWWWWYISSSCHVTYTNFSDSRYSFLSTHASGKFSRLYPVSVESYCSSWSSKTFMSRCYKSRMTCGTSCPLFFHTLHLVFRSPTHGEQERTK